MIKKIICGVLLLKDTNEILLQLRDKNNLIDLPNVWVFPGGHKKHRESIENCAKREFYEETNYKIYKLEYVDTIELLGNNKIIHYFYEKFDNEQKIICNEGQMLKFFNYKEILNLDTPLYTITILNKLISKLNK